MKKPIQELDFKICRVDLAWHQLPSEDDNEDVCVVGARLVGKTGPRLDATIYADPEEFKGLRFRASQSSPIYIEVRALTQAYRPNSYATKYYKGPLI